MVTTLLSLYYEEKNNHVLLTIHKINLLLTIELLSQFKKGLLEQFHLLIFIFYKFEGGTIFFQEPIPYHENPRQQLALIRSVLGW